MKNCLEYYYNIKVDNIHHVDDKYMFEENGYEYVFSSNYSSPSVINMLYEFSNQLLQRGIYCNQIILNKNQEAITLLDGKQYILICSYKGLNKNITIDDVFLFSQINMEYNSLNHSDWKKLWITKLDYLEYQISQFGINHPVLRNSFNYFSAFVETAIQLLNEINLKDEKLFLSHRRVKYSTTLYDLYSPLNFIVDYKIRDLCEYIKSQLFQKKTLSEVIELESMTHYYLQNFNLSVNEIQLFFVRLLYPSEYFDMFEDIITTNISDSDNKQLNHIIELADNYEKFVKDIYNYYFDKNYLPFVEWLREIN